MADFKKKEDYKVLQKDIDSILDKLKAISCRRIFYIGYADEGLVIALKDKYELILFDYFDKSAATARFWAEGDEEKGFSMDGIPINIEAEAECFQDIRIITSGGPALADVWILDIPSNFEVTRKPPLMMLLLDDAKPSNLKDPLQGKYIWHKEELWIGNFEANKDISKKNEIISFDTAEFWLVVLLVHTGKEKDREQKLKQILDKCKSSYALTKDKEIYQIIQDWDNLYNNQMITSDKADFRLRMIINSEIEDKEKELEFNDLLDNCKKMYEVTKEKELMSVIEKWSLAYDFELEYYDIL